MRRFQLDRAVDVSGVSGVGIVADGVAFPDGSCVVRWRGPRPSTVVWADIGNVIDVHGHGGATKIRWIDATPGGPVGLDVPGFATIRVTYGTRLERVRDWVRSWLEDIHAQRVQRSGAITTRKPRP